MKQEISYRLKIFLITLIVSVILIGASILSGDIGIIGNIIIISVLIVASPQIIFSYESYRSLKDLEENFPKLMMNITEAMRSGMPLHQAMITVSKYDYGKLTPEVKMIANQISWNINLDKVLDQFAERVKKSKRLYVSVKTIKEAYFAGGDIPSTLEHIASNINNLREVEKERKSILNQYVVLMYAIAIIFVGIVAAINKFMAPIFQVTSPQIVVPGATFRATLGVANPCQDASGLALTICEKIYFPIASVFIKDLTSIKAYYIALFFSISLITGFFSGIIAGEISEGSILAGLKHALIISILVFGAFSIMARMGFLG
jgi:flagellar protein FlaJ